MSNGMKLIILAALLSVGYGVYRWTLGDMPEVVLANGQRLSGDKVRSPIKAGLVASQVGQQIVFGLNLRDADGQTIRAVVLPGGRRPAAKITIADPGGSVLHTGTFRYG